MEQQQEHKLAWELVEGDYFEQQKNSYNPLRRWYHRKRYSLIQNLVNKEYQQGMKIVDLASGACEWNTSNLPVIGIDYSKKMLDFGIKNGRLSDSIHGDIKEKHLEDDSIDIIVISEALEHVKDYQVVLEKIHSMLKPNGKLILTVPYDTNLSLWKPFFKAQCFIKWNLQGNLEYKNEAGHINHFSPKTISKVLTENGFEIEKVFNEKRLTIFVEARKTQ